MPYFYLTCAVLFGAGTNVFGALFSRKNKGNSAFYGFLLCVSACLCWAIYFFVFDFSFQWKVLPYSALFGACYLLANIGYVQACKTGSASLSSLFNGLALLGVAVWGFCFWDEPITPLGIVGICMVAISVFLCLYEKQASDKKAFSWKWLLWALAAFVGNAGCSIVQKTQQMQMHFAYGGATMLFALLVASCINLVLWLKEDTNGCKRVFQKVGVFPILSGVSNFTLNLFVILLSATSLSSGVIYPVIGVGALMLTTLFTVCGLHEKLNRRQWLGMAFGAAAILLLSL